MLNKDIYQKDLLLSKLANEGVADVDNADKDILKYELETFVCEGEYEKGLNTILHNFIVSLSQKIQPACWVSGFFGSGKSHLLKMLGVLWMNKDLGEYGKPRSLCTHLNQDILDSLKELDIKSRDKNLHVVMGTLSAEANGSVRLAFLKLVLKSKGYPDDYQKARFRLYLEKEGLYEKVCSLIEQTGSTFDSEMKNFRVSPKLHQAVSEANAGNLGSKEECRKLIQDEYKQVNDISSSEMTDMIREVLTDEKGFPYTLFIVDEIQQFIADDAAKSMAVQELIENCSAAFQSSAMFIGSGQSAINDTPNLQRLEGRFSLRIELSDADVESVIRKVILLKKPSATLQITEVLERHKGEIARHLAGTEFSSVQESIEIAVQDYPILPTRRKFWDALIHTLDTTGNQGQLRNQLKLIFKAAKSNLNEEIGNVVEADYLFFDMVTELLNTRTISRDFYEYIVKEKESGEPDRVLLARACALVFLINKLDASYGIRATADTIADLMVTNLDAGSGALRQKLPNLLHTCRLIMNIDDEYRVQNKVTLEWLSCYQNEIKKLSNDITRLQSEAQTKLDNYIKAQNFPPYKQGDSQMQRRLELYFGTDLPKDIQEHSYLIVRKELTKDYASVVDEARSLDPNLPTQILFVPETDKDKLLHLIKEQLACTYTLQENANRHSPEDREAHASYTSQLQKANDSIEDILRVTLETSTVYMAGGRELEGTNLRTCLAEALKHSSDTLYPQFKQGDARAWADVYNAAQKGDADALKKIGHQTDSDQHEACKRVLDFLRSSKKGSEVREHFTKKPFGWSKDAVDAILCILLLTQKIRAKTPKENKDVQKVDRKDIGQSVFTVDHFVLKAPEKMHIRMTLTALGVKNATDKLEEKTDEAKSLLKAKLESSGGAPPLPSPLTNPIVESLLKASGHDFLQQILDNKESLLNLIKDYETRASKIDQVAPRCKLLSQLLEKTDEEPQFKDIREQWQQIVEQRSALEHFTQIQDYLQQIVSRLSRIIREYHGAYQQEWAVCQKKLDSSDSWQALPDEHRQALKAKLHWETFESPQPEPPLDTPEQILEALSHIRLQQMVDRTQALNTKCDELIKFAAKHLEPKIQTVKLSNKTIRTKAEADAWIEETRKTLYKTLETGPVAL